MRPDNFDDSVVDLRDRSGCRVVYLAVRASAETAQLVLRGIAAAVDAAETAGDVVALAADGDVAPNVIIELNFGAPGTPVPAEPVRLLDTLLDSLADFDPVMCEPPSEPDVHALQRPLTARGWRPGNGSRARALAELLAAR